VLIFKIVFKNILETNRPILIKLSTNHPLVKEIQVCKNKEPGPFQRGDNHRSAKIG
jgi:hypothetical protein